MAGKTAFAAVQGPDNVFKERLPDEASIYSAELHALYLAQDHVEPSEERDHLIVSDSKSSLSAMQSSQWTNPLVNRVLERHHNLTVAGKNVTYCWVPGHEGIHGNDLADGAAKDATNQVPIQTPLPWGDLKRKIQKHIHQKWQECWDSEINNQLQKIQPKIGKTKRGRCKSRREEIIMNRLRIGHTRLTHSY